MGLYEQAMPFFLKVTELAPFYLYGKFNISWNYLYQGEFDKSEGYLREALALNPRNPFSLLYLARYLLQMGKSDEAGQFLLELERTSPDFFLLPHYQALLYASRGEKAKALELYRDPRVYSLLGMNDEAIQSMTKEISEGTFYSYLRLINDPFYKNLRKDPRFEQIVTQAKKTHEELSKKFGNYF
jgi:tetratricopeptide (TPR) repeat protein